MEYKRRENLCKQSERMDDKHEWKIVKIVTSFCKPSKMFLSKRVCLYCKWVKYVEIGPKYRIQLTPNVYANRNINTFMPESKLIIKNKPICKDRMNVSNQKKIFLTKEDIIKKVKIFTENYSSQPKGDGEVYVLYLAEGRCYIGFSKNPSVRIKQQSNNPKGRWLKNYPALLELCTIKNANLIIEHELTDYLMRELGHSYIRGGQYYNPDLDYDDIKYFQEFNKPIIKKQTQTKKADTSNSFKPWSYEEEDKLIKLYHKGLSLELLSQNFKRTISAIEIKLRRFGYYPDSGAKFNSY